MKIALLGYGKMGKTIESLGTPKHEFVLKVDAETAKTFTLSELAAADVAIEFSTPSTAYLNLLKCFEAGVPVVVGTTAWLDHYAAATERCRAKNGAMLYAPNFSIGVNIFFEVNRTLARMMNAHSQYDIRMEEIHHTEKKDAPSGTAVSLAETILDNLDRKVSWTSGTAAAEESIPIVSERTAGVPGTHTIAYQSDVDSIEIKHTAHSREGFAMGALLAAEWIRGKQGVFNFSDVLNFQKN